MPGATFGMSVGLVEASVAIGPDDCTRYSILNYKKANGPARSGAGGF